MPSRGAGVGQTKALQKVEAMMRIDGWEMSANMAAYHAGELSGLSLCHVSRSLNPIKTIKSLSFYLQNCWNEEWL